MQLSQIEDRREAMKVIFFDVDGVLNTIREFRVYGQNYIDHDKAMLLVRLAQSTGAMSVLSSSWRKEAESRAIVSDALRRQGLDIHDDTPIFSAYVDRHVEIRRWLQDKHVERFAIIDDDTRASIDGHFFKVDEDIGLTEEICHQVHEFLY